MEKTLNAQHRTLNAQVPGDPGSFVSAAYTLSVESSAFRASSEERRVVLRVGEQRLEPRVAAERGEFRGLPHNVDI